MHTIQLGNRAFEGQNNAYLLNADGSGPTTLVDTGVASPEVREQLVAGLAEHGVTFADVEEVLVTHWHEDHAGLAGAIQAEGDATVRAHEADAPLVARDEDALDALADLQAATFERWNMPDGPRRELEAFLESHEGYAGVPPDVVTLSDGETLSLGDAVLEVVYLPGHTDGLAGFATPAGELLSGDALLPHYTPNVGGADLRVDRPLATYLDTLERIARAGYDRALPGHRHAIDDPAGRAAEIVAHHRERTRRVVDVLDAHGPADPWTVSSHLFGDLADIHIIHGPGEADAHLEHLATHGFAERTDAGYRLLEEPASLDGLFPDLSAAV